MWRFVFVENPVHVIEEFTFGYLVASPSHPLNFEELVDIDGSFVWFAPKRFLKEELINFKG